MLRRVSRESARSWFHLVVLPLVAASLGCGASSGGVGTNPTDAGRTTPEASFDGASDAGSRDGRADAGDASMASSCAMMPVCTGSSKADQSCVGTVDAELVDPSGAPAVGVIVTICGTDLCSEPITTGASGKVALSLCIFMASPSFRVLDDPTWAPFAVRLPADVASVSLGKVTVTPLPAAGATFPSSASGGSVSSNGVTLQISAAGSVTFDDEHQALSANARQFRAVEISALPPDLTDATVTDAWALAPENTLLAPGATLTVPNAKGWSPLAEVNFYLDGTDEGKTAIAPWGEWGAVGVGAVSADGSVITLTAASGGLREIGFIGLGLK
jgi:hypothetical protein